MKRNFSKIDNAINQFDSALRSLFGQRPMTNRPNPATNIPDTNLNKQERQHVAGLMRVNHAGEICAQGLYQGQATTAKLEHVKDKMQEAAIEENDHLHWCENRLTELGSHTSYLNPFWYAGSFAIGAAAGFIGDKWSLGFVAETENQVVKHLDSHLEKLPENDKKSQAILEQMKIDEGEHAINALAAGGVELPTQVKLAMSLTAKIMTTLAYKI